MYKLGKRILAGFLAIFVSASTLGCVADTVTIDRDGYLDLVDSPSTTLNNVWYNTGGIFRCAIFESLLVQEADMKSIKPALAESYKKSQDGLNYEFVMRDNVRWHDGEPVDAQDVLFSLQTVLQISKVNGLFSSTFQYIDDMKTDGHKIMISLTEPVDDFVNVMAQFAILPEHLLKDVDPQTLDENSYWKKPIGCGPYKITEVSEGEHMILEANPDYYGATPGIGKIRLKLNVENGVEAMKTGDLDFYVTSDPEEIADLKGVEGCSENRLNILFPTYLIFNLSDDEGARQDLKDARVRKALLMALDRDVVVKALFPGSTVSDTMVPSWDEYYLQDGKDFSFNPQAARALLLEAGFDFNQPLRLRYFTKGRSTEDLMNAIAVYWRTVGINVELEKFEGSGSEHMFEIRDYDVCFKRLSAFDYEAIYDEIQGEGVMQNSIYHMPVYDALIDQLQNAKDETSRKEIIMQLQELDQDYLLRLPLFALANVAYVNEKRLLMPEVFGNLWYRYDLHFEDWKLVK